VSINNQSFPVLFEAVNDRYEDGANIQALVWVGATNTGDRVVLRDILSNARIWEGRAFDSNTYQGVNLSRGISCPRGFYTDRLDGGIVYIYLVGV
jgi:hypothetical protein